MAIDRQELLADFPEILKPPSFTTNPKHNVKQFITTFSTSEKQNHAASAQRKLKKPKPKLQQCHLRIKIRVVICSVDKNQEKWWSTHMWWFSQAQQYHSKGWIPNAKHPQCYLANVIIFSCFDISWAYYNILLDKKDQKKTAIVLLFGLYVHKVMSLRLINAPKTWPCFLDNIFCSMRSVFIYLNDILIFSDTTENYKWHTRSFQSPLQIWSSAQHCKITVCTK